MKLFFTLLSLTIVLSLSSFHQSGQPTGKTAPNQQAMDTILFTMSWDFNGDCENVCYRFLGTGTISSVNGRAVKSSCNHLFIKCPTALRLQKGKSYRFTASRFRPNECSTGIDTCLNNLFYALEKELP